MRHVGVGVVRIIVETSRKTVVVTIIRAMGLCL